MLGTVITVGVVWFLIDVLACAAVLLYRKRKASIQAMPDLDPVDEKMDQLLDMDVEDGFLEYAGEDEESQGILRNWGK